MLTDRSLWQIPLGDSENICCRESWNTSDVVDVHPCITRAQRYTFSLGLSSSRTNFTLGFCSLPHRATLATVFAPPGLLDFAFFFPSLVHIRAAREFRRVLILTSASRTGFFITVKAVDTIGHSTRLSWPWIDAQYEYSVMCLMITPREVFALKISPATV